MLNLNNFADNLFYRDGVWFSNSSKNISYPKEASDGYFSIEDVIKVLGNKTKKNMHKLADKFPSLGINAFVKDTQRPERIYSLNDQSYTYYKHQSATGTGVEAEFNKAVGSADVNTLSDSTESDDLKKRD